MPGSRPASSSSSRSRSSGGSPLRAAIVGSSSPTNAIRLASTTARSSRERGRQEVLDALAGGHRDADAGEDLLQLLAALVVEQPRGDLDDARDPRGERERALEVVEVEVVVGVGEVEDADVAQRHGQDPVDAEAR